ncbi:hypothetical protein KQI38_05425 [Tissierella carlieri]|uniref:metallophosphoesterase n=1 Tax=Tissierella carlieri TaxID=689904 RepID=UPI001C114FB4|nr:metallophosphoesterase [Tissierella carlieri]MBU5311461.1 hypothetical protein [Tissierella carlieri]
MIKEKRKSKFIITNRKVLLIIFILSAFYNGLIVKNYKIRTDKILDSHSIRIVLISDLHSHVYGKNQSKIINKIKKQNPNIIALAGDIAPVFYVTGNHEIWTDEVDYIKEVFKSFNIIVLENDYRKVDINGVELVMAGVDDPDIIKYERPQSNWNEEIYKSFSNIEDVSGYKVLLSHRPEAVDFYNFLPFDMVLSGHSHGGQVRIPFILNGLFALNQGFFPKYAGGVYEQESYTHIVSRGVSFNPRLPRIFNPPEIVVIDIQGQ